MDKHLPFKPGDTVDVPMNDGSTARLVYHDEKNGHIGVLLYQGEVDGHLSYSMQLIVRVHWEHILNHPRTVVKQPRP